MTSPTRATAMTVMIALSLGATACSKDAGGENGPQAAAEQLARGLGNGDVATTPMTEDAGRAQDYLAKAYAGMGALRPSVTVRDVSASGDTATATLHHVWDLDSSPSDWEYDTTVALRRVDGAWKVNWDPALVAKDLQAAEVLRLRSTQAQRADILGQGGTPLVTQRAVWQVGIDKTRVTDAAVLDDSARKLATALELDPAHFANLVKQAGPRALVAFLTVRAEGGLTEQQARSIDTIPGAVKIPGQLPLAPRRTFASPYLGRVTEATAENLSASKGQLHAGDRIGQGGLQGRFDAQLRGSNGIKVVAVNPNAGDAGRLVYERTAERGKPLRTTLDEKAQNAADDALKDVKTPSAAVVVKVSTGEVLAVANGPGTQGYDTATLAQVAPGSTFKVVTALAMLRSGLTPDSTVQCPEKTVVDGRSFQNYADYPKDKNGSITLKDAIAHSCNTALIGQHGAVSQSTIFTAAQALGLGKPPEAVRPWFLGSVPEQVDGTEHAAGMIGQGKDLASPLGMAVTMASVMKGSTVAPVLLPEAEPAVPLTPAAPLTGAEAQHLRTMMRAVVTEGGGEALRGLPGGDVIAKTGTAEYGTGSPLKHHTWMIAGQGDYALAVFVEDGDFGSTTCGPIMASLIRGLQGR